MDRSRVLYGCIVFLSAFLLFLIEPIAAKELLPVLGGSSAVWITCLVFFQATLLGGYIYAHWLSRLAAPRLEKRIHLAVIACATVMALCALWFHPDNAQSTEHPVLTIFVVLAIRIGLPFLLLGSTTSLLQVWWARNYGGTPYRLFALSNASSLLALALYPTVVEPLLTLRTQRLLWTAGVVLYAVLFAVIAWRLSELPERKTEAEASQPLASLARRALWFFLPMVASIQLSAVTRHLTSNVAAIPLLWTMPLGVYLLTFILAFNYPSLYRRALVVRILVVMLASLGYVMTKTDVTLPISLAILFYLVELLFACLFLHAETYRIRPGTRETTLFYLLIAAGGVSGAFFVGIASPLIFSADYDIAISFLMTAVAAILVTWPDGWGQRLLWGTGTALLAALLVMVHIAYGRQTLVSLRNFYGTLRVRQMDSPAQIQPVRLLVNGTIQHGMQSFAPGMSGVPMSYYAHDSGIGLAMLNCCGQAPRRIGVIGLGTGTVAAYGRAGDTIRFYEINPLVAPIAQHLFTYLRDSKARITIVPGDARTSLSREAPQGFQVLVIDAFSGDSIPLHLLTTQAMQIYRRHLAPDGVLVFHVSNQYVNLPPEIALLADAAGMKTVLVDTPSNDEHGEYRATWILVANQQSSLPSPAVDPQVTPVPRLPNLRVWTDDYSSVLPLLRWKLQ